MGETSGPSTSLAGKLALLNSDRGISQLSSDIGYYVIENEVQGFKVINSVYVMDM